MSALSIFDFEEQPVRTQVDDAGEPWFFAVDLCRILDLDNPSKAVAALDEDERMTLTNTEGHSGQRGGAQSFNLVNESGLYSLIFRSRKPQAKAFKRWVTREVLPALRKTGRYAVEELPALSEVEEERRAKRVRRESMMESMLEIGFQTLYDFQRKRVSARATELTFKGVRACARLCEMLEANGGLADPRKVARLTAQIKMAGGSL